MIDHVLGRPSTKFRKIQVFAVVSFWSYYLLRGNSHGPPGIRALSSRLSMKLTTWQTTVILLLWLYVCRNFAKIVGLECPEPLANLYSRSFFRATWITTAMDAGFWTAMKIKPKWLRDLASLVFTVYYLFAAEQADEKVRRVRATLTVDHLRVSWNKGTTPYLWALSSLCRPRLTKYPPRAIRIPRPRESVYEEPTNAWLYFDGPLSALRDQTCVVLDVPGGGFVAMGPRQAEDKLLGWAGKTKVPILSLDYKKAPEHPYPYALNECYDVYHTIVATRGRCLGLSGHTRPKIVITGDSAGGNLAVGLTLMVLQSGRTDSRRWQGEDVLPRPDGLVLGYPSLNMRVESWMTEEQMSLIQEKSVRKRKNEDYYKLTPSTTPGPSGEDLRDLSPVRDYFNHKSDLDQETSKAVAEKLASDNFTTQTAALAGNQPKQIRTRLAVSSMISYVHDRILTPEMMRAMIILYIGPYNRPDFSTDFLLSPVLAPEALLARFPKTYFLTGERDPLVDDTVIFAGRLRQAKLHQFRERQELGLEKSQKPFNEKDHVEVTLIPGISHGFLQFAGFFPDAWKHINRSAKWIQDLFAMAEVSKSSSSLLRSHHDIDRLTPKLNGSNGNLRHHKRSLTGESSADEDKPLEMSIGKLTPLAPHAPEETSGTSNRSPAVSRANPKNGSNGVVHGSRSPANGVRENENGRRSSTERAGQASTRPRGTTKNLNDKRKTRPPAPLTLSLPSNGREAENPETSPKLISSHKKSFTSLPSEEDLLGRRMNGLAGGLMGIGEGAQTP